MTEERYEVEEEFDNDDLHDEQWEDEAIPDSHEQDMEKSGIWQTIRRFFFQTPAEKQAAQRTRVYILNQAIENYPDAAVNYLLRGELYLELRQYTLAQQDFEMALELATAQYDNDRWGLGSQAIVDRAWRGLQRSVR